MIKLIDFLPENLKRDKSWPRLGKLYHNTDFKGMYGIVKDGMIIRRMKNRNGSISFSRAKRFWKDSDARIVIDGKKLAAKYPSLEPYDWGGDENEWEEAINDWDINKVDVNDSFIKVLLKPHEESRDEWLEDYLNRFTKERNKLLKKWPEREEYLKSKGYDPKEVWNNDPYLSSTEKEKEKKIKSGKWYKSAKEQYLPKIIELLKAKNIPYEITDNFPSAS
jgi:hypothetical protein